jgi:hypothetical protein
MEHDRLLAACVVCASTSIAGLPFAREKDFGREGSPKQPDVLMLHYLLTDDVAAGSLEPNLAYYGPRTAHGSTLSPGVDAALLARSGQLEQAVELLRMTAPRLPPIESTPSSAATAV